MIEFCVFGRVRIREGRRLPHYPVHSKFSRAFPYLERYYPEAGITSPYELETKALVLLPGECYVRTQKFPKCRGLLFPSFLQLLKSWRKLGPMV